MKTWSPDTCRCKIEEIYDGSTIVGGGEVLKKCADHADLSDGELYDTINSENTRKNLFRRLLLGIDAPELQLGLEETKADGSKELIAGCEYVWSFEGTGKDRVLRAAIKGANLELSDKAALTVECEARFGKGKIEVE